MEGDERFVYKIKCGYRMDKPVYATNEIGKVMSNCWEDEPSQRPTFTQLINIFGGLMDSTCRSHYLSLSEPYERVNQEKQNYQQSNYFNLMSSVVLAAVETPPTSRQSDSSNNTSGDLHKNIFLG